MNMKRTSSSLILAMALGVTCQPGHAGLVTEPLGVKGSIVDQGISADTLGFKHGASAAKLPFDGGDGPDYITPIGPGPGSILVDSVGAPGLVGSDAADSLVGSDAADSLVGSDAADSFDGGDGPDYLVGSDAADSFDGGDGPDYVYEMIEMALSSAGGVPVTLQDLFVIPGVFDALHAKGRMGDDLRGYVDWLMMTGLVVETELGLWVEEGTRLSFAEAGPAPSGELKSVQGPMNPVNGWKVEEGTVVNGYTEVEWTYLTGRPQEPSTPGLWVEEGSR